MNIDPHEFLEAEKRLAEQNRRERRRRWAGWAMLCFPVAAVIVDAVIVRFGFWVGAEILAGVVLATLYVQTALRLIGPFRSIDEKLNELRAAGGFDGPKYCRPVKVRPWQIPDMRGKAT